MDTLKSPLRGTMADAYPPSVQHAAMDLCKAAFVVLLAALCASPGVVASGNPYDTVAALNRDMRDAAQIRQGDEGRRTRDERLQRVASEHADFSYTAQLVLGDAWTLATPEQRDGFTAAFRSMLLATFSEQMVRNAQAKTVLEPTQSGQIGNVAEVRTRIAVAGSAEQYVIYHLHNTGGSWKLFDVVVDGLSLVALYKGSIRSEARRLGLDGLIDWLVARNLQQQKT